MSKMPLNAAEAKDTSTNYRPTTKNESINNKTNINDSSVMSMFSPLKNEEETKENTKPSLTTTSLKNNIEKTTKLISNEIKYSLTNPNHTLNSKSSSSSLFLNRWRSNESLELDPKSSLEGNPNPSGNQVNPSPLSPSPMGSTSGINNNYLTNSYPHSRKGSASSINSFLSNASNTESINKQYQRQKRIEQLRQQLNPSNHTHLKDKASDDAISLSSSLNSNKSASHLSLIMGQGLNKKNGSSTSSPNSPSMASASTTTTTPLTNAHPLTLEKRNSFSNAKPPTSSTLSNLMSSLKRSKSLADKTGKTHSMSPNLSYSTLSSANPLSISASTSQTSPEIRNTKSKKINSIGNIKRRLSMSSSVGGSSDVEGSPSLSRVSPSPAHIKFGEPTKNLHSSSSSLAISLSEDLAHLNQTTSLSSSLKSSHPQLFKGSNTNNRDSSTVSEFPPNDFEFVKPLPPSYTNSRPSISTTTPPQNKAYPSSLIKTSTTTPTPMEGVNFNHPWMKESMFKDNDRETPFSANHRFRSQSSPAMPPPSLPYLEGDSMISDTSTITSTMIQKNAKKPPHGLSLPSQPPPQHPYSFLLHPTPSFSSTSTPSSPSTTPSPPPPVSTSASASLQLPIPKMNSINDFLNQQELRNQARQAQQMQEEEADTSHTPNKISPSDERLAEDYIRIEDIQAIAKHSIPHQMLLKALENSVEQIRDDFQEDITNMHLEIIRQLHIQKIEFEKMFNQYSVIGNLQKEIDYLREENLRLKNQQRK